jgi:hypothetical protein
VQSWMHLLLRQRIAKPVLGPIVRGRVGTLGTAGNPDSVLEWSNTMALIWGKQGQQVSCEFTVDPAINEVLPGNPDVKTKTVSLEMRYIFEPTEIGGKPEKLAVLAEPLVQPGELSQGLCSPWQNDYRECACYYWAPSRPDYVNVVAADELRALLSARSTLVRRLKDIENSIRGARSCQGSMFSMSSA